MLAHKIHFYTPLQADTFSSASLLSNGWNFPVAQICGFKPLLFLIFPYETFTLALKLLFLTLKSQLN